MRAYSRAWLIFVRFGFGFAPSTARGVTSSDVEGLFRKVQFLKKVYIGGVIFLLRMCK